MLSGKNNQQQSKNLDKKYSIVNKIMLTYDTPTYMFNVYKNQPSRQTGSRNLMGPKNTSHDMKLVTKYQISAINSC